MKLTFPIVITDESGTSRTEELMILQKSGDTLNDIGLSVSESKQLGSVQKSLVQQQADEYIHQHIRCPHCFTKRRIKGQQKIQYRTLFSVIRNYRALHRYRIVQKTVLAWDNFRFPGGPQEPLQSEMTIGSLTIRSAVSLCVTNERIPTFLFFDVFE